MPEVVQGHDHADPRCDLLNRNGVGGTLLTPLHISEVRLVEVALVDVNNSEVGVAEKLQVLNGKLLAKDEVGNGILLYRYLQNSPISHSEVLLHHVGYQRSRDLILQFLVELILHLCHTQYWDVVVVHLRNKRMDLAPQLLSSLHFGNQQLQEIRVLLNPL